MKKASHIVKAIIIAIVLAIILIFSFQNLHKVPINILKLEPIEIPLFLVLFGVLSLGILMGYLLGLISGSKVSEKKINEINLKANEQIVEETTKAKAELEAKNIPTLNE